MSNGKSIPEGLEDPFKADLNDENYEMALGRLMIAWADAEKQLYHVLVAYSGVSDAVGRALFSGTRMKEMTTFVKSIDFNEPLPIDRSADLAHVFPQIGIINEIRNHLVHYSSSSYGYRDLHRVVVNTRPSRYGNASGYEISAEIIDQITQDLYAIAYHLRRHHSRPSKLPFTPWREDDPSDPPTPWLYKQLPPIEKWEKSPASAQTSPLQQKSSPQKSPAPEKKK